MKEARKSQLQDCFSSDEFLPGDSKDWLKWTEGLEKKSADLLTTSAPGKNVLTPYASARVNSPDDDSLRAACEMVDLFD